MRVFDSNGNELHKDIRREGDGWGVTVWFGGWNGLGTDVRRHVYKTREQARNGYIGTDIGKLGRIA